MSRLESACIRGCRTEAQVGLILLGSDIFAIQRMDWPYVLGCGGGGFVLAVLMAVAGLPEVPTMAETADINIPKGKSSTPRLKSGA